MCAHRREVLTYYARLDCADNRERSPRRPVRDVLEIAGLTARQSARRLAGRADLHRLSFAQAALGGRRVLLLDETLSGLDAFAARDLCGRIARLAAEGVAVLIAARDPAVLERLRHVLVMRDGRIVRWGRSIQGDARRRERLQPARRDESACEERNCAVIDGKRTGVWVSSTPPRAIDAYASPNGQTMCRQQRHAASQSAPSTDASRPRRDTEFPAALGGAASRITSRCLPDERRERPRTIRPSRMTSTRAASRSSTAGSRAAISTATPSQRAERSGRTGHGAQMHRDRTTSRRAGAPGVRPTRLREAEP